MSQFYDKLDATGNIISAVITLASLGSSATAGRKSDAVTLVDGSARVPTALEIDFWAQIDGSAPTAGGAIYLFMAPSVDETTYSSGPPAVGAGDNSFTFTNTPMTAPTSLKLLGVLGVTSANDAPRKRIIVRDVPAKAVFIVLNNTGRPLTSTAGHHGIIIRKRWGEVA